MFLFAALLGVNQGVCGDDACGSGWKVTFSGASTDDMHTTSSSYDLGTLSDIYDKDLNISKWESWWSKNDGNLCGTVKMYWKVDNGTESNSTNNKTEWENYYFYNDNPNIKVADKYFSVGEHTLDVCFTSSGALATNDCDHTVPYPSSGTFQMTFTVPAPTNIYITGDAAGQSWGNWTAMTKNSTTNQWYKSVSAGICKISFKKDYENDWYNNFTADNTRSVGSTVSKTSDNYKNISIVVSSGYEDPVLWIDVETRTFWAVATASCTAPTVVTNNTPENVTGTTATLKCTVTEAGDCQNQEIGIAYGTSEHPTSGTEGTVSGGVCSVDLTNLVAGKYYYYRAYTTVGGTTTYGEEYGFYTKPANIYIKGLIIHPVNGCPNPWPTDNTAFSMNADGTVFTKTITARKPNCSYENVNSDAEFVLMSSTYEADKLNVKGTFNPDGQNSNWIRSKRSGNHDEKYNFKYSAEYNAGDQLTITVTFMSDGTFKMKVSPACDTEVQKKNISIASSAICSGSSVNVTVASSQSGVTYTVYDAANNEVGTGTGTGVDLNISVSPSASTTFTVKGSQGAACESTTMNNTVDVTVWNAPKYSPTSNITAYLPITITGTAGSSWSITSPSSAGNAWFSNTSGLTTVFKAPAGTYTVQDSNTSCTTNSVTITVDADSETCQ